MLPMVIGVICMTLGWACRIGWHYQPDSISVYIPQVLVGAYD
jgi:hypothetical protein